MALKESFNNIVRVNKHLNQQKDGWKHFFHQCSDLTPIEKLWSELKREVHMHTPKNILHFIVVKDPLQVFPVLLHITG